MNEQSSELERESGLSGPKSGPEDDSAVPTTLQPGTMQAELQVVRAETERATHSGPLPDLRTLEAYERVFPGSAERIWANFDKEVAHRHKLEWATKVKLVQLGQWLAAVLSLVVVAISGLLISASPFPFATALLVVAGLAGVFVWYRRFSDKRSLDTETLSRSTIPTYHNQATDPHTRDKD